MFRTFITAAILALTITAAQAGDSVTVRFGDLDLAKASDAQVLAGRVHAAATLVCASDGLQRYPVKLEDRSRRDRCIADVNQTLSAKVLAMAGQSRKFAGK
jgi:UrcA family protein